MKDAIKEGNGQNKFVVQISFTEIYIFNFNRSVYLKCGLDILITDLKVVLTTLTLFLKSTKILQRKIKNPCFPLNC